MRGDVDHTPRCCPGERLHQLFEQRCDLFERSGDAGHAAVEAGGTTLSYAQLDARANRLARALKRRGIGAGDVVALMFDKGADSYAAMLAVLKVHAAYIPLDASFPPDRIDFITRDATARLTLSTGRHRALLDRAGVEPLCVDTLGAELEALPSHRLDAAETGPPAGELCYIIYTSGTTGRPKGVPIEHAAICNFVRVAAETYGYRADDRVYQGLTLAFDFAVEEIWVPLVVGATLLPNGTGANLLGADLAAFLHEHRVTALCCVPTLLATVEHELPSLRLLIVSGEACPRDLVERWHRPGRTMLNAYGPTETTVTATVARLQPGGPVTIGSPLPTYAVLILDPETQRVLPFGEAGEIAIAGIGVARGYLNRPEQTRKAFINDFVGVPHNASGRLYRTGDLGRIEPHGELSYLGRIDTQIKLRGYRIELAEIESLVLGQPGIAQAAVGTHVAGNGETELVAYYTWRDAQRGPAPSEIADALREQVPGYMVPAYYERLDALPMLPSDKVDRKALPPPCGDRLRRSARAHVEPADPLETTIADAWAQVMGIECVSADDDFFEHLGASSLQVARFGARLRERIGAGCCGMQEVYGAPTVRRLAATLRAAGVSADAVPATVAPPAPAGELPHRASTLQYLLCGTAQVGSLFAYMVFYAVLIHEGGAWLLMATDLADSYRRAVTAGVLGSVASAALPVAMKWTLVGRWTTTSFPVWSLRYLRFWAVKRAVQANPMVLFAGTPLYVFYLRCLGARVSWRALVLSPHVPACTDLVHIGDDAVVSRSAILTSYRAEGGRIHTGPVSIGAGAHVGEACIVDAGAAIGDRCTLRHASSVQRGQRLPDDTLCHGSPARPVQDGESRVADTVELPAPAVRGAGWSLHRRALFTAWQLAALWLILLPLPLVLVTSAAWAWLLETVRVGRTSAIEPDWPPAATFVTASASLYVLGLLVASLLLLSLPRLFHAAFRPGRVYPLHGIHQLLQRGLETLGNSKFHNELFGDSSAVVHYLRALGYRFRGIEQTGSNFGMEQHHDDPLLCEIGRGTMVSDGLRMSNAEYATTGLHMSPVRIPPRSFLGNRVAFPSHARVGENCLYATKVAVPVDGPLREHIGLLGSPCFPIPRTTGRRTDMDRYRDPVLRRQRLRLKNRSNGLTMGAFLAVHVGDFVLSALFWRYTYFELEQYGALMLAAFAAANLVLLTLYHVFIDRLSLGFGRLQPRQCSIYDDYFWTHERHWKLGYDADRLVMRMLNGTTLRGPLWRLLGVRVGRRLFDDGCAIIEKTLVTIGDDCTLNNRSVLHSHSLEDGNFKSDHIRIGDACSVGVAALVHYGVETGPRVCVEPDAFVMKGERPAADSRWCGNPAREVVPQPSIGAAA